MVSVIKFIEFILSSKQKQDDNREKNIIYIYYFFWETGYKNSKWWYKNNKWSDIKIAVMITAILETRKDN